MANIDLQNRAPSVTRTPDFRNIVQRRFDVLNWVPKTPASILANCWLPLGSVDDEYTDAYLIEQKVEGQNGDFYGPCKFPPVLVRTYEELDGLNETPVGEPGYEIDQYDNTIATLNWVQLSAGTAVYQVPGDDSVVTPNGTALLMVETRTDNGTLRTIQRKYTTGGILADNEELKFGGKLLLRTIKSLSTPPATPAGYTLITESTEYVRGLPLYSYGFANGGGGGGAGGVISTDIEYRQSSDEGTTGVTIWTIRYLTDLTVEDNPITAPAGSVLIAVDYEDDVGYRMWTAKYAKGVGEISRDVAYTQSSDEGTTGVTIWTIRHLVASGVANPITPPSGTVLVSEDYVELDGYAMWTARYAKGVGEISRDIAYTQSSDEGTVGVTTTTIRHLVASGDANPITPPAGTVLIEADYAEQDGYAMWTARYAKGAGEVGRDITYQQSDDAGTTGVTVTTITHLTAGSVTVNPTTPPASTVLVKLEHRMDSGYKIWTVTYAKGTGLVLDATQIREGGKLYIYNRIALGAAPSTPSATISGTVTLISSSARLSDGYEIFDYTWAEGIGEVSRDITYGQSVTAGTSGSTTTTIRHLTAISITANPTSGPGGSVLIRLEFVAQDGYKLWTAVYGQGAGTVLTEVNIREGGELYVYRIIALGAAPSAPSASTGGTVTLISTNVRVDSGYTVYDYQWAEGNGEVGRDIVYQQSTDQGTTGVTITTITHLTALATSSNPTSGPGGSELVKVDYRSQDGYKIWTAVYAAGTGLVLDEKTIREGGNLYVYHRVALGSAPSAPAASISGTVTLIASSERQGDGYAVFDYQWAEGIGEVSSTTEYQQSSDEGTTGATITTIRQLTALSVTANPTTGPGSSVLVRLQYDDQDGYRVWTAIYGSGTGTVDSDTQTRDGGTLKIYRLIALGAAPSAPAGTIGGTVTLIDTQVREDNGYQVFTRTWAEGNGLNIDEKDINAAATLVIYRRRAYGSAPSAPAATIGGTVSLFETNLTQGEGYAIYEYRWAEGFGLNIDEKTISASGALVVYRRRNFGAAPSTPAATIGGTVTLFETNVTQGQGYAIYDYRWSEGDGQASIRTEGQPDGAIIYTVTDFNAAAATPAYPGAGTAYLISLEQNPKNGYFQNTAVYKKPPATITYNKQVSFQMPGEAVFSGSPPQLVLSPPVTQVLLASVEVSYDTTQISDAPFTVEAYCSLYYTYVDTATGTPHQSTDSMGGYLAGASSISGTNDFFNGVMCDSYAATLISSVPSARPTGAEVLDVDNDPYLVSTAGTIVYRRMKTTYSF